MRSPRSERAAQWLARQRRTLSDVVTWHRARCAEILLSLALIGGWGLVTFAVAALVQPRIVWPLSGGLLLLSASGWQVIWSIITKGCYALHVISKRREARGEG